MKNMKIKYNNTVAGGPEDDGYYPTLNVEGSKIPELKDMKIGDTCELKIKVKVVGMRADSKKEYFDLEVREGEYAG